MTSFDAPRDGDGADDRVSEVIGRIEPRQSAPAAASRSTAPGAHKTWGPEFWPVEVRENVKAWPPVFRERELLAAIRGPLTGRRRVALVSNKDGVGKSTTALILQTIFATFRAEMCAVVDANVDTVRSHAVPLAAGGIPGTVERLEGNAPTISPVPGETDYTALIDVLGAAYPVILCDVGTGIGEVATRQILESCDQIVVVATPAVDGLYAASSCLDDLSEAGFSALADNAICAINRIRPMPFSDLLNIDRHFSRRCREVIRIPWDARATCDNAAHLDELRPTTRTGFFELAAAVARSLGDPPFTTKPREEEEEENG